MTAHRLIAVTVATGALALAAPALAEPDDAYEYAEPAEEIHHGEPAVAPPPVPPLPAPMMHAPPLGAPIAGPAPHGHARSPHPHAHGGPPPMGYRPVAPFDRDAWLADCRERIRGVGREERSGVIGGLLGAAAGGVIGNRAWDSERLAGTLLGAGVGGLAGLAIGSAIGAAGDRRREDECAWHLDRYLAGGYPRHAYGHPGYGHAFAGYGYPTVAYVPVLVAVPQRAVVRETVTEEWIDVPVRSRSHGHGKVIRTHAPAPDKRVKYTKGR